MTYGELLADVEKRLVTATGTVVKREGMTGWSLAIPGNYKFVLRRAALVKTGGTFRMQLCYQTAATRIDKPDAWIDIDGTYDDEGVSCSGVITPTVSNKAFIRFGLKYWNTSSDETAEACVILATSYDMLGEVIATKTFVARAESTADRFEEVSEFVPMLKAQTVKFVFIVSSVTGSTLNWRATCQKATTEKESPGTWATTLEAAPHTGASELTTDNLSPASPSGDMWVRFGVQYSASSTSLVQGTITVMVLAWR